MLFRSDGRAIGDTGLVENPQDGQQGWHIIYLEGWDEPVWKLTGMVEKPKAALAPSRLFIVGRYLLSPRVMELLKDQKPGAGNEIQLTDAMERCLAEEEFYALVIDPKEGYDTGTVAGWIATNARMAQADPRFASAFEEAMSE